MRHTILFNTINQVIYDDQDFNEEDMGDPWEQVSNQEHWESLNLKRRIFLFQLEKRILIDEHMNNFTKLLADLANMDAVIEDKALILLSSLPDGD